MTQFPRLTIVPATTDRSTVLLRRFYPQATDESTEHPKVAVATGFAESGGLTLQSLAGLAQGDARAIAETATANTKAGPRTWSVAEKSGFIFKKPSLLRGMGDSSVPIRTMTTGTMGLDDLSSDLILDEAFMATASQQLGATDLIAAIPKRGWLMVARCKPGELPVMMKFTQIADGIASRGGEYALTTACYFLANGKVVGVSGASGYVSLLPHDQAPAPWSLG